MTFEIENKKIDTEDFTNLNAQNVKVQKCTFTNCSFKGMNVNDFSFGLGKHESIYEDCCFDDATFSSRVVGYARFINCRFLNVSIKEFWAHEASFIGCRLSGTIEKGVIYGEHDNKENTIIDNDFSKLIMADFDLREVDFTKQQLPEQSETLFVIDAEGFLAEFQKNLVSMKTSFDEKKLAQVWNIVSYLCQETKNNQISLDKASTPPSLLNEFDSLLSLDYSKYLKQG